MEFLEANRLEFVLNKRYLIKLLELKGNIKAFTKDLQSSKESKGIILGISINFFAWIAKNSLWASSRFSLNPKTLEIAFLKGLQGGGSGASRNQRHQSSTEELKS